MTKTFKTFEQADRFAARMEDLCGDADVVENQDGTWTVHYPSPHWDDRAFQRRAALAVEKSMPWTLTW